MSAFVVSKVHIDILVAVRHVVKKEHPSAKLFDNTHTDNDLGRMLWRENMLSVAHLYPDHEDMQLDEEELRRYRHEPMQATVVECIKAIHCYQYQACEHDGWETSDAKKYVDELHSSLVMLIPGYKEAPYSFGNKWAAEQGIEGVAKAKLAAGSRRR